MVEDILLPKAATVGTSTVADLVDILDTIITISAIKQVDKLLKAVANSSTEPNAEVVPLFFLKTLDSDSN